jgi:hypothetical protein
LLLDHFSVERIPEITDTDILQFQLPGQTRSEVIDYVTGTVHIEMEAGSDPHALLPQLIEVSPGATIAPPAETLVDFTAPATYQVTAADGVTTQDWTIEVLVAPSREAEMVAISIPGQTAPAEIDTSLNLVSVEMPYGTDLTSLVPRVSVSEGATVDPPDGTAVDLSEPVLYTVIAEDRITQEEWSVLAKVDAPSSEAQITGFGLYQQIGASEINEQEQTIAVVMPFGSDVTAMVPEIELSPGANVDPAVGDPVDFSSPVTFTVTAQDGITLGKWTVRVAFAANTETEILGFALDGQAGTSVIDPDGHSVTMEVPYGTGITALVPAIELSAGATIDPPGGTASDFSSPVTYTITAQDGTTRQDWTVQVVVMPNNAAEIIRFSLNEQKKAAAIDPLTQEILIEVSAVTDLTSLIPTIELSPGAVIDPPSGERTDFTFPVEYVVTAEDGVTTKQWRVTVQQEAVATGTFDTHPSGLHIYPNPASESMVVEFTGLGDILVLDLNGRSVLALREVKERAELPVSQLERGIYFVAVKTVSGQVVTRVVLE